MDGPTDQTRNLKKVDTIVHRESRVNCDKQTNQQTDMTSQGRVLAHMKKGFSHLMHRSSVWPH